MDTTTPAISISSLRKSYGDREAVRGVSFDVAAGECFGLLGHDGAGKTTTIEILEGYLLRDAGSVSVLGADPGAGWRSRIGIVLPCCSSTSRPLASTPQHGAIRGR